MEFTELIRDSSKFGWRVKTARYVSEDKVLFEFEKSLGEKLFHVYVLADADGAVIQGYNFFEDAVPLDSKSWDKYVR